MPGSALARNGTGQEKVSAKCRSSWAAAKAVIAALEDADDYAAFEFAVAADYNVRSAVERELVLRLASFYGGCVAPPRLRTGPLSEVA